MKWHPQLLVDFEDLGGLPYSGYTPFLHQMTAKIERFRVSGKMKEVVASTPPPPFVR